MVIEQLTLSSRSQKVFIPRDVFCVSHIDTMHQLHASWTWYINID